MWKLPVEGGGESQVLDALSHHTMFAVADRGIHFIPSDSHSIQFLNFATSEIELVTGIGDPFGRLGASPDERWILYAQEEQTGADLMLVDNFR
ncbi:MAG: hypothetical protein GY953_13060 [bacterium]|nr:hypothetical protein [bacterium]